jgi:hypothetical protein
MMDSNNLRQRAQYIWQERRIDRTYLSLASELGISLERVRQVYKQEERRLRKVEIVARTICRSSKFECGEGCCAPICMSALGNARQSCAHTTTVHAKLATEIVDALSTYHMAPHEHHRHRRSAPG